MKKTLITSLLTLTCFIPCVMAETPSQKGFSSEMAKPITGIQLGQTRVVIKPGEQSSYFNVISHDDRPFIISSYVLDENEKRSRAFAVDPGVFQLPGREKVSVRVLQLEALPQDKESLFWLQVNSVVARPEDKNQKGGALNIALGQRIKLFYRPAKLEGDAQYAAESLIWQWKDGYLTAVNPTKFWVSMTDITINGKNYKINDMVRPAGAFKVKTSKPNNAPDDGFAFVNEYGGEVKLPFKMAN